MAVRPTKLGLRSSGGSVLDPPVAPAAVVRAADSSCRSGHRHWSHLGVWLELWYGGNPNPTAIAAARLNLAIMIAAGYY